MTEHWLVLEVAGDRVHDVGLNAPAPVEVKLADPVGLDFVPEAVSDTVAVQLVPWFTATEAGEQDVEVEVERVVTVTVLPAVSEELLKPPVAV